MSHIPEPSLGYRVQMCVQVVSVSPSSLELPHLSARMASVYNVRRSEEMWNLVGVVTPGLVCAVGDREGGWYRGVVVDCVKDRLVMVQCVHILICSVKPFDIFFVGMWILETSS